MNTRQVGIQRLNASQIQYWNNKLGNVDNYRDILEYKPLLDIQKKALREALYKNGNTVGYKKLYENVASSYNTPGGTYYRVQELSNGTPIQPRSIIQRKPPNGPRPAPVTHAYSIPPTRNQVHAWLDNQELVQRYKPGGLTAMSI